MGKKKRVRVTKRKQCKNLEVNESNSTAASASGATQVQMDIKEAMEGDLEAAYEIEGARVPPIFVYGGNTNEADKHKLTEDIKIIKLISHGEGLNMTDNEVECMIKNVVDPMKYFLENILVNLQENMTPSEYRDMLFLIFKKLHLCYKDMKSKNQELVKNTKVFISLELDKRRLQIIRNVIKSSKVISKARFLRVVKRLRDLTYEDITTGVAVEDTHDIIEDFRYCDEDLEHEEITTDAARVEDINETTTDCRIGDKILIRKDITTNVAGSEDCNEIITDFKIKDKVLIQKETTTDASRVKDSNEISTGFRKGEVGVTNEETTADVPFLEDCIKVITDFINSEEGNVEKNKASISVEDIKKEKTEQKLKSKNKSEKDGDFNKTVQEHNRELEYDDQALMKIPKSLDEKGRIEQRRSKIKQTDEIPNRIKNFNSISDKAIKICKGANPDIKTFKKMLNRRTSKKGIDVRLEEIKASKDKVDQINDMILDLKKLEGSIKEKDFKSDNSYVEVPVKSLQNAREDKSEDRKVETGVAISIDDNQDILCNKGMQTSSQEVENCKRTENKEKTVPPKEQKTLPTCDFRIDMKGFMMMQKSKLEEQRKNSNEMQSEQILIKGHCNTLSSEKGPSTAAESTDTEAGDAKKLEDEKVEEIVTVAGIRNNHETEKVEEIVTVTGITNNHENEKVEEIVTVAGDTENDEDVDEEFVTTDDDEPNEIVIELDKNIHKEFRFDFEPNYNKHIFAGDNYYFFSSEEKQSIKFNYEDENFQVSLSGNHVNVSTETGEYDIFVQKSNAVASTDAATQTDNVL